MKRRHLLGFLVAALVGGAISSVLVVSIMQKNFVKTQDLFDPSLKNVSNQSGGSAGAPNFTYAADQTIHSVVHVKTYSSQREATDPLLEFFFGYRQEPRSQDPTPRGAGSGVIVTKDGYIVTNNHVIEDAEKIEVTLNDKRTYQAKVVGADPNTDIALLKIEEKNLPFIKMGDSDNLRVGEWVIAVGNPFNLTSTVTAGIVSAKGRNFPVRRDGNPFKIESYIQTDAVVNPGNSGGALVNTDGELVGINTAIYTQNGVFNGYSFAVPVSIVKKVIYDLMEYGSIQRAFLGVSMSEITSETYDELKLKDVVKGVYVAAVNEGGAAADAGVKVGDIITAINNEDINSISQVQEQVSRYRPGDNVEISVIRDGKVKQFKATLRKTAGGGMMEVAENGYYSIQGATFANVSPQLKNSLRLRGGVQIVDLKDGLLKSQGIRKGLIILRINRVAISSVENLAEVFANAKRNQVVTIEGVYPNGLQAFYSIGM